MMRITVLFLGLLASTAAFAQPVQETTTTTTRVYTTQPGQPVETQTTRTTTTIVEPTTTTTVVRRYPGEHWLYFQQGFHPNPPVVQEQVIETRRTQTITPVR